MVPRLPLRDLPPASVMLPVLLGVLSGCDAAGIHAQPRLRALVAMLASEEGASSPLVAREIERFLHPSREDIIAALYRELARLSAASATDAGARREYERRFAELRAIQEEAVAEMRDAADAARTKDAAELDDLLARADGLLARHGDAS